MYEKLLCKRSCQPFNACMRKFYVKKSCRPNNACMRKFYVKDSVDQIMHVYENFYVRDLVDQITHVHDYFYVKKDHSTNNPFTRLIMYKITILSTNDACKRYSKLHTRSFDQECKYAMFKIIYKYINYLTYY